MVVEDRGVSLTTSLSLALLNAHSCLSLPTPSKRMRAPRHLPLRHSFDPDQAESRIERAQRGARARVCGNKPLPLSHCSLSLSPLAKPRSSAGAKAGAACWAAAWKRSDHTVGTMRRRAIVEY